MHFRGGTVLAALALCAGAGPAAASPAELFGFGGRSPGMAQTGVATATDSTPPTWIRRAGDAGHRRITGFLFGDFDLEMDGRQTGTERATAMFGGAIPVMGASARPDRFGIGFLVPSAINRAQRPFPGEPVFALLETRARGRLHGAEHARLRAGAGVGDDAGHVDGGIHVSPTPPAGSAAQQNLITRLNRWRRALLVPGAPQLGATFRAPAGPTTRSDRNNLEETCLDGLPSPSGDLSTTRWWSPSRPPGSASA
jgi:hypothetical protein